MSATLKLVFPAVLVFSLVFVAGCKDDHETVGKKMIDKMTDLTAALKDVKDEASSKAAAPKVKSIATDIQELQKKADALPKLSADEQKKLEDKYAKPMGEAMQGFMGEAMRIGFNPKLMTPELKAALDEMDKGKKPGLY
jgi:hypothetical protein